MAFWARRRISAALHPLHTLPLKSCKGGSRALRSCDLALEAQVISPVAQGPRPSPHRQEIDDSPNPLLAHDARVVSVVPHNPTHTSRHGKVSPVIFQLKVYLNPRDAF